MVHYLIRKGFFIKKAGLLYLLIILVGSQRVSGQTISNDIIKQSFRNEQLLGHYKQSQSFSVNANQIKIFEIDSLIGLKKRKYLEFNHGNISFGFLPITVTQQYNSELPYEWNQGSMIPAKGFQSMIQFGGYLRFGKHVTIQIAPEIVSAENKDFETFKQELGVSAWASYYKFLNSSDIPERFGSNNFNKIMPGQSSIMYNAGHLAFGLSTQNLWWGPGYKNALVMSNNAPGFLHASVETIKPIHTGIGNIEGQVIFGTLSNSGILPPRINSVDSTGNFIYKEKDENSRYLTGMVLTWQPKWVKGLFLGFAKASYLYTKDLSNPLDAIPLQGFLGDAITATEGNGKKSSLGSVFARYIIPNEQAELYMEFGRKDKAVTLLNIIPGEKMYRRAYVAGFRKLFNSRDKSHILLAVELTQMQAPTADLIRNPDSWYTDQYIRQGYTNKGRVLGAGIGPGSNSETVEISWVKGFKKIGLQFERLRHNSDFYYYAFESIGDFRRHWVDISTTLKADWNYKQLFFSCTGSIIRSYNHEWFIVQIDPTNYFAPGNEVLNFTGKLAVSYRF